MKKSLRCALVVAIFTSRQLRNTYSWISARIQCTANETRRTPTDRVEALHGLHQADVAFLDQVSDRQSITHVAARDVHHETQVREHQLARRVKVVVTMKTGGELEFGFAAQHRNLRDSLDIGVETS